MAKEVVAKVKLMVTGGQATPAPPVGPVLSQHQVNIGAFVRQFNEITQEYKGVKVGVILTIYKDKSFEMVIKGPPVSVMLKQAAGIVKGSGVPNRDKVGKVTKAQVLDIVRKKINFMNAYDENHAIKLVEGTAKSMGIDIIP
ncbi:MAG: 50S ribosomal protein L11 [Planctomycetes bacterium]|jgi:large subunit ribosomal protein L11|nr:50S ribosomal protein L11 [Planctomycetota bacterium]HON43887.1 50S ribosomal protein L11 [Planctomycetota bacterium]HPY73879.1 50S ribosomal protein L11 [Planctomycetota bacterium]HQA99419.1 50S ribosomal protein L11 [Planctomycetota bacterium]HRU50652.1 50S ribosomal protein L11 [Planctomycetota bacterium]